MVDRAESMPSQQGARAWAIFAVCSLGFVLSQFYRVSATVISPELSRDLDLEVSELGGLSAAFFYAFAASQVAIALTLDRVGARRSMSWLSIAGLGGAALFAAAQGLGQAVLGRVLLGVGLSCHLMGPLALLAAWFPPGRFATISGLLVGLGYLGNLLAATPLAWLTQTLGWRWAFALVVGLHAAQTVGILLVVRDRPPGHPAPAAARRGPLDGMGSILLRPAWWVIGVGSFFRYGCFAALMGLWAGPLLMGGLGLSPIQAGNALLAQGITHVLALPLFGRMSDQVLNSRKWVVVPGMLASAALTLALGLLGRDTSLWLVYGLFAFLGLAAAPGQVMYAHAKELAPRVQGASMTGVNLFTMLGPAAVMQGAGELLPGRADQLTNPGAFWPAWWLMAGGLGLAGLLYLWVPDTHPGGRSKMGDPPAGGPGDGGPKGFGRGLGGGLGGLPRGHESHDGDADPKGGRAQGPENNAEHNKPPRSLKDARTTTS